MTTEPSGRPWLGGQHRVHAEGALALRDDVHRPAGLPVQPPDLGGDAAAQFGQGQVAGRAALRERAAGRGHAPVGELLDQGPGGDRPQGPRRGAAGRPEAPDLQHRIMRGAGGGHAARGPADADCPAVPEAADLAEDAGRVRRGAHGGQAAVLRRVADHEGQPGQPDHHGEREHHGHRGQRDRQRQQRGRMTGHRGDQLAAGAFPADHRPGHAEPGPRVGHARQAAHRDRGGHRQPPDRRGHHATAWRSRRAASTSPGAAAGSATRTRGCRRGSAAAR